MKMKLAVVATVMGLAACSVEQSASQTVKETEIVERQQSQYSIAQPVPAYDYSLERDLIIQLYNVRNQEVTTHSVWRSNYGQIEGDCRSMGYGLPYDTSLTNPQRAVYETGYQSITGVAVGQPEPNGVFASTNTSATWVFCLSDAGRIEPVYVEAKVTVYPGPVEVNYSTNRVSKAGEANVTLKGGQ